MVYFLCVEGILTVFGLGIILAAPREAFGKNIAGYRYIAIGMVLFLQAPIGLTLSQFALGGTQPGPIDGADLIDARNRIAATCIEWTFLLASISTVALVWFRAPLTEEQQAILENSPYQEEKRA